MMKISDTTSDVIAQLDRSCTVTLHLITCKKEAPRNDEGTGEMSVKGALILKSVIVLVSKWRGRVLIRKNCLYLNRWANPPFINFLCELGCSGDPIGLNPECSQQVNML